ncbi:MAG: relaxase domain-containing protein, partial [Actinomycetota bacterium]|nr:relaxase domain-containing protein [Actinomycetota bacterium]
AGAAALGFVGTVAGEQLVEALVGRHPLTGRPLTDAKGSSARAPAVPKGSRPVARDGHPDESLTIPEAAFLAGVDPSRLRRLAEHQPQTRFPVPTPCNEVDPRVGRRLVELLTGAPVTAPWPGADKDYLLADKDPESGEWRVRRGEVERYMAERVVPETVMGFDIVCAAPKSVSLLWAVGDEAVRADIAAAFDTAVDATISYLEAHACYGMVDGRNQPGDGLAMVSYVHDVSRANEAHLHLHNLVPNAVRVAVRDADGRPATGPDGQARVEWRALDSGALLRHVKTAGFIGAAQLRHDLATRWGVEWSTVRNGVAELARFPEDLLHSLSSRHDQVVEEFAQLVEDGYQADGATEDAAQRRSRPRKTLIADAQMRALQTDKLAEIGWTAERVLALIDGPRRALGPVTESDVGELADRLVGPAGLTARKNTFTTREVHQAVAQWAGDRLSAKEIRGIAEGFLADRRVVLCGLGDRARTRQDPNPVFTTEDLLASEDNLQTLYRQGRVDHGGEPAVMIVGPPVERALAAVDRQLREERGEAGARLSDEQREVVRDVLGSGDRIRCVLGPAGTGKTEAMRAAAAAWEAEGCVVVGSANGGTQTEELGRRLGLDAQVVRAWLTRLETAEDPRQVWPERSVVVVDEATQVATRDAEKLARWATRTGSVVVFVGDPAQLGSVGAGGWFRHIVYAHGAPYLSTVYRQAGSDMAEVRAALSGLRSEMPQRVRRAMDRLATDGRVVACDNAEGLLARVVDDWYADRQERLAAGGPRPPKPSRMMAAHRREVDALNALARRRLVADGTVRGPELAVGARRFAVGDEVVTLTQAGHTLVPVGATRDRYVRTGTVGVVTAVHLNSDRPEHQSATVEFPGRGLVRVEWAYLTHEFDDGRTGALAHAYAVTADRSQGSTMHAARAVGTDSTSRAAFYVMVSRGEREVAAYLVRDRDLETNLDDEQWLPVLRHPGGPFQAVVEQLERSRGERLASDLDPLAWDAQRLRRSSSLAELAGIRRAAEADPEAVGDALGVRFAVARRAEMAEETSVGARAVAHPDPALVARLGPRPSGGDHQRSWDQAVRAVAVYRCRWGAGPGACGYGGAATWAIGSRPAEESSVWSEQRAVAEQLVARWAAALDPGHHRRLWELVERIPRERATAGVHALVAAGIDADHIYQALSAREKDTARAGAAVLEYRVKGLLSSRGVDAVGYLLPRPLTAASEWDRARRLLTTAEANHLSRHPVADLAAERRQLSHLVSGSRPVTGDIVRLRADVVAAKAERDRVAARVIAARERLDAEAGRRRPDRTRIEQLRAQVETWQQRQGDHDHRLVVLTQRLSGAKGETDALSALGERHQVLTLALDLLVDRAIAAAADQPPPYLVDLLGERPPEVGAAKAWDARVRQLETWRHHTMGLAYGVVAAGTTAPPSQQALGPVPGDPTLASLRARLLDHCQATLDLAGSR